jgi:hypothetical protein
MAFAGIVLQTHVVPRVARWIILIPKIPIWVNLGEPWNGKCWQILGGKSILQRKTQFNVRHLEMQHKSAVQTLNSHLPLKSIDR